MSFVDSDALPHVQRPESDSRVRRSRGQPTSIGRDFRVIAGNGWGKGHGIDGSRVTNETVGVCGRNYFHVFVSSPDLLAIGAPNADIGLFEASSHKHLIAREVQAGDPR